MEIKNGVRPGDWVVVSGMQRLKNDKAVKAEKYAEDTAAKQARSNKSGRQTGRDAAQDTFVTYDLPIAQTVTEFERIQGGSEAIFSVQVTARVSGYMTEVNFKDGDLVKEGDLLFRDRLPAVQGRARPGRGQPPADRGPQGRLEKEYHRAKNLIGRGSISPEEYDRYESDFKETEAGVRLAKANRDLAQLNYDWCEVRASTSGRLSRRMVDPGNLVKADDDRAHLDRQPRSDLRLFRRPRAGHAADQAPDATGKGQAQARCAEVPVEISLADEGDDKFPHKGIVDFTDNKVDFTPGHARVPGQARQQGPSAHTRACSCGFGCRSATPTRR